MSKKGSHSNALISADLELEGALKLLENGANLRRVKHRSLGARLKVHISPDHRSTIYYSRYGWICIPNTLKSMDIGEILEIRSGWNTDNFNKASEKTDFRSKAPQSHCFSIIFRHPQLFQKSVDFVADDAPTQRAYIIVLNHWLTVSKKERLHFNEEKWLIAHFDKCDINNNGYLTFEELWELLKKLNLEIGEDYGRSMFQRANIVENRSNSSKITLNKSEFLHFFRNLTERPELLGIMKDYSTLGTEFLMPNELTTFLNKEQGFANVHLEKAEQLIEMYEPDEPNKKNRILGPIGFRRLLLSSWGSLFKPEHSVIYQNMHLPLHNYFINSSHNTYLTGLQLKGEATVEGYVNALKQGARLLELDVFDGNEGEPVITHKRTLISPISLRDALTAISRYAFDVSPYPLILTIENHVGINQQKVMAEIFRETFGARLYRRPDNGAQKPLASPEALRGKIMIRGKKLPCQSHDDVFLDQSTDDFNDEGHEDDGQMEEKSQSKGILLASEFSELVSIPSVKIDSIESAIQRRGIFIGILGI